DRRRRLQLDRPGGRQRGLRRRRELVGDRDQHHHGDGDAAPRVRGLRSAVIKKLLITTVAALVLAAPAAATVKLVHVTSPAYPGGTATLTASVSQNTTCGITVLYKSGSSHASGLYPKRASNHRVSWTWNIGTNTTAGRWKIYVDCGKAGLLSTSFVVG